MTKKEYQSYRVPVPNEFDEVFSHFYVAENNTGEPVTKNLLPTFQTILVFNFGAASRLISETNTEIEVDKCLLLGPIKRAFTYTIPPNGQILVANFKNDAFYRFFGLISESSYLPAHPDSLLEENCFTYLWQQLAGIQTMEERTKLILDFCKPYLKQRNPTAGLLANFSDTTQNPIKAIADQTRLSERALQLQHKKYFGFTAKEKLRYQRFLNAIKYLQENPQADDWFDVIIEFGYYDQSHLIHDFQHYLNLTPNQYLKFHQDICIAHL